MIHGQIYYKHSGGIGSGAFINMTLLGALAVLGLGALYGFAIHYVSFVYLNFFITLAYGGLVGLLVGWGGKLGKVRNPGVLAIFGVGFGVLAVFTGWVSWIFADSGRQLFLYTPVEIMNYIRGVARDGSWSIFDRTPTGGVLYVIWILEAILIIFSSTAAAWGFLASKPFCEACNLWVDKREALSLRELAEHPQELKRSLERGDFSPLRNLAKGQCGANASTKIELFHCPNCHQTNFLTVKSTQFIKSSNGKEKEEVTPIVENLIITHSTYQILKQEG